MVQDYIPESELERLVGPLIDQRGVSATYRHYKGTAKNNQNKIVDDFDSYTITILTGKRKKFSTSITGDVHVQQLPQSGIFRVSELDDLTLEQLTRNDQLQIGSQTLSVKEQKCQAPFFWVSLEGG